MSTPRSFTVLSLNIWNRGEPWEQRRELIREGLRELSPDVVTLQEVLELPGIAQAHELAEGLGYDVTFGRDGDDHYAFGNAILSRWPARETRTDPLPREGTRENRCIVYACLDAPWGKLPVFSTHLNWKLHEGPVRLAQVRFIARLVAERCGEDDLPAVLAGDFNAEPASDEVRFLAGLHGSAGEQVYFADCFGVAGGGTQGATFVGRNPYAAPVREPDRRIDYVFVRGPNARFEGYPIEAKVVFDGGSDGVWASDHLGVWARIGL